MRINTNSFIQKICICIIVTFLHKPINLKYVPRYLKSLRRNGAIINEIPWITFEAKKWLDKYLKPNMLIYEYGCGGSTLYFSKRVKNLISIEYNKKYYRIISEKIRQKNFHNCDLRLIEINELNKSNNIDNYKLNVKRYAKSIKKFPNKYFDLVFIDGWARNDCIKNAIEKIKPGAYLMLDNSEDKTNQAGIKLLNLYNRTDFYGLGPSHPQLTQTTIWKIK